eukprot:CAMPEP_0178998248 /NCGR_PEP_ID=MMETSP0795-20121207/9416_1 /TAXON_ID=88552 /ORGANISM="Amoebophrya sp., Strain Ameob2" /LENGTH=50 /DNA_ID=CAMNT_0020690923 /DNA_START=161 /DNA_END=313 /DNA_ORIENTATION=+
MNVEAAACRAAMEDTLLVPGAHSADRHPEPRCELATGNRGCSSRLKLRLQ